MHPLLAEIENKLRARFAPSLLRVQDESHQHAGHGGAAEHARDFGEAAPSHVHIEIASDELGAMGRLARHRAVQEAIAEQVETLHALRLTIGG